MSCVCHGRARESAARCHLNDRPKQHMQGHDSTTASGSPHAVPGCPAPCPTIILPLECLGVPYQPSAVVTGGHALGRL